MFKIAICDDNESLCHYIEDQLYKYASTTGLELEIEVFYSGLSLYNYLKKSNYFDLIYLDIEMEQMSGIELGSAIRNNLDDYNTEIIYISGTSRYHRQLFSVQPLNFISKPIDNSELYQGLALAIKRKGISETTFSFQAGKDTYRIKTKDILYFESQNKKIKLVASQDYFFYEKLSNLEKSLPSNFFRIHRCYIINIDKIVKYTSEDIVLSNGQTLPLGRTYKDKFLQKQLTVIKKEF